MNRHAIPYYLAAGLLFIGIGLLLNNILHSLQQHPIYIWDEAIYANNAIEMAIHNNYLVYTRDGLPDHYNTKPPLVLWLQVLSFKAFGYHEFALRLPSFLALLAVIFLFFAFCRRNKIHWLVPILSTLILLSCLGAIRPHVFLSGDLDAILVCLMTIIFLIRMQQIATQKISPCSVGWMSGVFILAYLAKSTAIFLILPSILFSFILSKQLKALLRNLYFYLGSFVFLIIVIGYYFLREKYDPGYFDIVYFSEFQRFTANIMEWHQQPFWFYFKNIIQYHNAYYTILTLLISIPYFLLPQLKNKKMVIHLLLIIFTYLLFISIPRVKLDWYDAPIYPIWAFALAIILFELSEWVLANIQNIFLRCAFTLFIICLLVIPVKQTIDSIKSLPIHLQPQEQEGALLKQLDATFNSNNYIILMDVEEHKFVHFDALNFYIKTFYLNMKKNVHLKRYVSEVKANDTILVVQQNKIDSLKILFNLKQVATYHSNYFILDKK